MSKTKRHIAYITGTRADFGLMTSVLKEIDRSKFLRLELYATGMHLMPKFGRTISHVQKIFPHVRTIRATFPQSSRNGLAEFTAVFMPKLIRALQANRPDLVLVLGDRVEMLCVALACLYLNIPTAHLHGGEKSSTVDDTARHAISKLAHVHFPATRVAAQRLRKMGEEPWRIHRVGAPGLDTITYDRLPTRTELFRFLHVNPKLPIILVTQHPVTEEWKDAGKQMGETLAAVQTSQFQTVITYPNADPGSKAMIEALTKVKANPQLHIVKSLPYLHFLALEREAAVWIGNSSAGVIESASFRTPVVNVGSRQRDREQSGNVLNVPAERGAIRRAMHFALTNTAFRRKMRNVRNCWGDGRTGKRVRRILEELPLNTKLLNKKLTYA